MSEVGQLVPSTDPTRALPLPAEARMADGAIVTCSTSPFDLTSVCRDPSVVQSLVQCTLGGCHEH